MPLLGICPHEDRSMIQNPNCGGSHCHSRKGEVRLLPTGGDSNAILCRSCFRHEMKYRKERIAEGVEFDLPKWNDLKVYEG